MASPNTVGGTVLLAGATVVFMICCAGVAPLMDAYSPNDVEAVLVSFCVGAILAAVCLVTAWSALGPGTPVQRMGLSFISAVGLLAIWSAGYDYSANHTLGQLSDDTAPLLLFMPLVWLVVQLPLWAMGQLFRWRIVDPQPMREAVSPRPLTTRGIMLFTALVAGALGSARLGLSIGLFGVSDERMVILVSGLVCTSMNVFGTLPILFMALRAKRVTLALLGIVSHTVFCLLLISWVFVLATGSAGGIEGLRMISALLLSYTTMMVIPLFGLRLLGLRLQSGRRVGPHSVRSNE